jgi:iron complex outermembrane receptor protein
MTALRGISALLATTTASAVVAQAPVATVAEPLADGGEIVVTGTRFAGRSALESPTPVDALPAEVLERGARADLTSALRFAVPGFSTPRPTGSSSADFAAPASLRGLSPGQLLVLVNGRRRHSVGELSQLNSVGRGDITYDLNPIPIAALARVEVLRDGAAAQYGSDAVAGVINLILDESTGGRMSVTGGTTTEGDGEYGDASVAYGIPVGSGGVVRATLRYADYNGVNRARPDTRQQYFGQNGTRLPSANFGSGTGLTPANGALDPREASIDRDVFRIGASPYRIASALVNGKLPLGSVELRGFANYSRLEGDSDGFFRRAGQDENVRAVHPGGFRPSTLVEMEDFTVSVALGGGETSALRWDLATVYGGVRIDNTHRNSVNPSLGAASPREFYRGGTDNSQWTTNLDLSRDLVAEAGLEVKLALGAEYREDYFDLLAGERDSFRNGGVPILDGPNAGRPAPVGAQPTPGTTDTGAVSASRHSVAGYAEIDATFADRLTLVGAVRHEDYSDFGSTTNAKLASRFKVTDALALRLNWGTGFRAPVLAHRFFSTTTTTFVNGQPTQLRVFRVDEAGARAIGARDLKPETSETLSGGFVVSTGGFSASLDIYRVSVDDRIVISSQFQDARVTALLAQNGVTGVNSASFLTNAVDSVTRGFDARIDYATDLAGGQIDASLAVNRNKSRLTRIAGTPAPLAAVGITTPLFDRTQQVRFTDSLPRSKVAGSVGWERDRFALRATATRFGKVSAVALTGRTPAQVAALVPGFDVRTVPSAPGSANADLIQTFGAKTLVDLEASVRVTPNLRLTVGADNLFDVYPDENIRSTVASVAAGTNGSDNAGTVPYNPISPFGFSGRAVFARLTADF